MLFRSSRRFERRKNDSPLAKFCNFHLEGLFLVRDCSLSLPSTRLLYHSKHHFKILNVALIYLRRQSLVIGLSMFLGLDRF